MSIDIADGDNQKLHRSSHKYYYYSVIDLYSAMSRMEHESERCDGAEPS